MQEANTIFKLLDTVVSEGGSDLHISAESSPIIRVDGALIPLFQYQPFTPEETLAFAKELLNEKQLASFTKNQSVDLSYMSKDGSRFRCNVYVQRGSTAMAFRAIPKVIKTFSELGLPSILEVFANKNQGFFLVVGPVGQGKSTTLASMIELINSTRSEHIVTIEDPIEYLFESKKSLIEQREVNVDTPNFHEALRSAFRQDMDVIMLGEMRSQETISSAVTAAETGHLVLSTLHTNNAAQTIDRIIDSFPAAQQTQVRTQLAGSLAGIFSQRLIPKISGGLVPAYEVLVNNSAVSNLIREGRTHEINTVIQTSSQDGMMDMDRSLSELVRRGDITVEHAYEHAFDPKVFERYL